MNQSEFLFTTELIVDNFAGGGGASLGIEQAFGRSVDIAINHDHEAIAMHQVNHPDTKHYCEDVWKVDPVKACNGRPIGLAWFSPDCKHHSKAKGSKPVSKKIRGLAWIVVKWVKAKRPRVIMLENVEEFADWGPLKFAENTDGTYKLDTNGNPVQIPCPHRKGKTFERWTEEIKRHGYKLEYRILRACDYGAPTIRKRLFLIARCDGRPINWPKPTHGDPKTEAVKRGKLLPWATAAQCIDWHLPTPSIFLTTEQGKAAGVRRPLAENTMKRIAKGVQRFVIDNPTPFIVKPNHTAPDYDCFRGQSIDNPMQTITATNDRALVIPCITEHANASSPRSMPADEPLRTICAEVKGGHFALLAANMMRHFGASTGSKTDQPVGTITAGGGGKTGLVTSTLIKHPAPIKEDEQHIGEVRAFLTKYYGPNIGFNADEPMHTATTKHRFGLVTVSGEKYIISDIGMRMLTPRELFRAQGFPDTYKINLMIKKTETATPKPLSKSAQVRMCGNSVVPHLAKALVLANVAKTSKQQAA